MSQLNAFVAHSFAREDHEIVESILKFLNQVKAMDIGFTWESAEPAEPKDLADKVMRLIKDKNLFIGICTVKEGAIEPPYLNGTMFSREVFKVNERNISWKTSDWIIQEIGLAIGRGLGLILLVEKGLRQPGGLQGNLEYIEFERSSPEKSLGKVLEMIRALLPKAKALPVAQTEIDTATEEKRSVDEDKSRELLEPKQNWHTQDYEWALLDAVAMRNEEAEKRITEAYLATVEGQIPANHARWSALRERLLITFGQRGKLRTLEKLAADHSENSDVQRYLGLAYSDYEEYMKAGQSFILAAKKADDKKTQMARYADAAIAFTRASQKEPAEDAFKRMKALALQVDDGEVVLIKTLRELADIKHDRDLFFGSAERHLELYPDDTDSRFSLAYKYSQAAENELSLFHYSKIPFQQRTAATWNNLGVQFEHCGLPSKSVEAYRRSEELGETLAMSNLAEKLIKAGFLKEAAEICSRANRIPDYHKNVSQTISKLKAAPEDEQNNEKNVLGKAKPLSDFYRDYGRATAHAELGEYTGRWRGPDCDLLVTINGKSFLAEGDYETAQSGTLRLAMLGVGLRSLGKPQQMDKYHVKYTGEIYGRAVNCNVTRQDVNQIVPTTLLSDLVNRKKALMIISESLREIRVYEKDSADKAKFYELTRLE
ncbi:MAG TPA: hypothetical protein VGL70_08520 [Candidatus Binatia bacterium]|jgi:hypothetical protein